MRARIGRAGSTHRLEGPDRLLMVPAPPAGRWTRSPTLAVAGTQFCPSAPVRESETLPTTEPGMKKKKHPCKDRDRARMAAARSMA
jgi:hypothetical protein